MARKGCCYGHGVRNDSWPHTEGIRPVSVEQLGRTYVAFADHACDPGQSDLQFVGRRSRRKEQSALHAAGSNGLNFEDEADDGRVGAVSLQMKL